MATIAWTATNGSRQWSNKNNWSPLAVPTTGDSVFIDQFNAEQSYSIRYDVSSGPALESLLIEANVTLAFEGNNRTLAVNRSAESRLTVSLGQLNVGTQGGRVEANNLTINGGGIAMANATAMFKVASTAAISGGRFDLTAGQFTIGRTAGGAATTVLGLGGSLSLSGGSLSTGAYRQMGGVLRQSGGALTANGPAIFLDGTASLSGGDFNAGVIFIGAPLTISGGTMAATAAPLTIGTAGSLDLSGTAVLDVRAGGFVHHGVVSGSGTIKGTVSGTGEIVASNGTLEITGSVQPGSSFSIAESADSVLQFDGAVAAGNSVRFIGAGGTLSLADPGTFGGIVEGLVDTDVGSGGDGAGVINLVGRTIRSGTIVGGNTLHLVDTSNDTFDIQTAEDFSGKFVNWSSDGDGGTLIQVDDTVCYAAGTRILTSQGEMAIERLREGDLVVTLQDGKRVPRPVTWVGTRRIDLTRHPHPEHAVPVRIRRHAFGEDVPKRDLLVSPAHGILIDGELVPAKMLVNDMTVLREAALASVTYWHVELAHHAILLAEGLPAESYLDTGNRAFFGNAGLALVLHPEFHVNAGLRRWEADACAPLLVHPAAVQPIWRRLAERAEVLGYQPPRRVTTQDAGFHLVVDGRAVWPVSSAAKLYHFVVPRGAAAIRLVSRASAPSAHSPWLDDCRRLGVAVRSITIRAAGTVHVLPADHPSLTEGWYSAEHEGGSAVRRWTNGNALLPIGRSAVVMIVEIRLDQTTTYLVENEGLPVLGRVA